MQNPKTPEEWQEAVDLAYFYLLLDSARQYGLVTGGPEVNLKRAEEIAEKGRKRGITPRPDAVERILKQVVEGPWIRRQ